MGLATVSLLFLAMLAVSEGAGVSIFKLGPEAIRENTQLRIMFASVILLTVFLEALKHFIEKNAGPFRMAVLHKVYEEMLLLGIVAFSLVALESMDWVQDLHLNIPLFEWCHFAIFFVSLCSCLSSGALLGFQRMQTKKWDRWEKHAEEGVLPEKKEEKIFIAIRFVWTRDRVHLFSKQWVAEAKSAKPFEEEKEIQEELDPLNQTTASFWHDHFHDDMSMATSIAAYEPPARMPGMADSMRRPRRESRGGSVIGMGKKRLNSIKKLRFHATEQEDEKELSTSIYTDIPLEDNKEGGTSLYTDLPLEVESKDPAPRGSQDGSRLSIEFYAQDLLRDLGDGGICEECSIDTARLLECMQCEVTLCCACWDAWHYSGRRAMHVPVEHVKETEAPTQESLASGSPDSKPCRVSCLKSSTDFKKKGVTFDCQDDVAEEDRRKSVDEASSKEEKRLSVDVQGPCRVSFANQDDPDSGESRQHHKSRMSFQERRSSTKRKPKEDDFTDFASSYRSTRSMTTATLGMSIRGGMNGETVAAEVWQEAGFNDLAPDDNLDKQTATQNLERVDFAEYLSGCMRIHVFKLLSVTWQSWAVVFAAFVVACFQAIVIPFDHAMNALMYFIIGGGVPLLAFVLIYVHMVRSFRSYLKELEGIHGIEKSKDVPNQTFFNSFLDEVVVESRNASNVSKFANLTMVRSLATNDSNLTVTSQDHDVEETPEVRRMRRDHAKQKAYQTKFLTKQRKYFPGGKPERLIDVVQVLLLFTGLFLTQFLLTYAYVLFMPNAGADEDGKGNALVFEHAAPSIVCLIFGVVMPLSVYLWFVPKTILLHSILTSVGDCMNLGVLRDMENEKKARILAERRRARRSRILNRVKAKLIIMGVLSRRNWSEAETYLQKLQPQTYRPIGSSGSLTNNGSNVTTRASRASDCSSSAKKYSTGNTEA